MDDRMPIGLYGEFPFVIRKLLDLDCFFFVVCVS